MSIVDYILFVNKNIYVSCTKGKIGITGEIHCGRNGKNTFK